MEEDRIVQLIFEPALKEYMDKKGYVAVYFDLISAVGCCADTAELNSGFVKAKDLETKAKSARRRIDCEDGTLLIMDRAIEFDEKITLGMKSFLGAKDIVTKNIRPWSL